LSRSNRQFYVLQTLVWLGYGFEQFLSGIGVGRPLDYYKICLLDVIFGDGQSHLRKGYGAVVRHFAICRKSRSQQPAAGAITPETTPQARLNTQADEPQTDRASHCGASATRAGSSFVIGAAINCRLKIAASTQPTTSTIASGV